jgi:hypothetical protein
MRALLVALPLSILTLFPVSGNAGDAPPLQVATVPASENVQSTNPNHETYRGHYVDFSEIAARQDFAGRLLRTHGPASSQPHGQHT